MCAGPALHLASQRECKQGEWILAEIGRKALFDIRVPIERFLILFVAHSQQRGRNQAIAIGFLCQSLPLLLAIVRAQTFCRLCGWRQRSRLVRRQCAATQLMAKPKVAAANTRRSVGVW